MQGNRVTVVGAGIGGLVATLLLACKGFDVTVVERASTPGGKLREIDLGGVRIDAGPTVFTMKHVFEEILDEAGFTLDQHLGLRPLQVLARHAWTNDERLDLYADLEQSVTAIGDFSGADEARRYRSFTEATHRIYTTLENSFIRSPVDGPLGLIRNLGLRGLPGLMSIRPYTSMWRALGGHFKDPRLRQLFGRYATYCGSSPFLSPATLMLIAHVEREGVWLVEGGMYRIVQVLAELAAACSAKFLYGNGAAKILTSDGAVSGVRLDNGEMLATDAVILNTDVSALANGLLGASAMSAVPPVAPAQRSLSAVTWSMLAHAKGFPLVHHTVFFSGDYAREFKDIFSRDRLPFEPTVYVCAQDRGDQEEDKACMAERIFCLVNAPANGDIRQFAPTEISECEQRMYAQLKRCGLELASVPEKTQLTLPGDFNRLFPGTGGALYGRASHGWMASFQRPGSRTRIAGLYLAGGSAHPGAGIPMAALSGKLAATALFADRSSTGRSRTVAMPGGTSMQ